MSEFARLNHSWRCVSCTSWAPPAAKAGAAKARGTCRLDRQPAHSSYSCPYFTVSRHKLPAILGVSEAELAWLKAHAQDPVTLDLRRLLAAVSVHLRQADPAREAFLDRVTSWRWDRIHAARLGVGDGLDVPDDSLQTEDEYNGLGRNFTGKGV
jgi:hypothetical protein